MCKKTFPFACALLVAVSVSAAVKAQEPEPSSSGESESSGEVNSGWGENPVGNGGWGTSPPTVERRPEYRPVEFEEPPHTGKKELRYRARIARGSMMVFFGSLGIIGAGALGFAGGYTGNSVLVIVGSALEVASLTLFIPGLVMLVKNKKRLRHERRRRASFEDGRLQLVGLSPVVGRGAGGMALDFRF